MGDTSFSKQVLVFSNIYSCLDIFVFPQAINNIAVCLLYMGRLKEALTRLESMVQSNPEKYLDEALLFNLCTLYELESSKSGYKKQLLLGMVNKHKGDGFNVSCLKMM